MRRLPANVDHSIRHLNLLGRDERILVAVSGGLDSMTLLHVLHGLSGRHGWRLAVAHLNHQLRGRSSDADERLVISTSKKLGLPVVSERIACKAIARARKLSLEMAAREVRHEFLARAALRLRIRTVAVAHHADDQVELFFVRLLRGSGNEGLAGMKWAGPSPADSRITLVRPLLDQSKAALRDYAVEEKIRFREDASNACFDFVRNRIRHELLPLLRAEYQPSLDRAILRVMDIAGAEAEFAGRVAADWLKAKRKEPFRLLPVAVQRRCIQLQLLKCRVPVDFALVEQLRKRPGISIKVSADSAVMLEAGGRLVIRKPDAAPISNPAHYEVDLRGEGGEMVIDGVRFRWRFVGGGSRGLTGSKAGNAGREVFDADKVGSQIVLRHWRAGDRFQPSGMRERVKLQDLFTNNKIPRDRRHRLIVAARSDGEVFWVEDLRIAERFKLSKDTIRCLQWRWKRL